MSIYSLKWSPTTWFPMPVKVLRCNKWNINSGWLRGRWWWHHEPRMCHSAPFSLRQTFMTVTSRGEEVTCFAATNEDSGFECAAQAFTAVTPPCRSRQSIQMDLLPHSPHLLRSHYTGLVRASNSCKCVEKSGRFSTRFPPSSTETNRQQEVSGCSWDRWARPGEAQSRKKAIFFKCS